MWNGVWTEGLDTLYDAYMEKFGGALPYGSSPYVRSVASLCSKQEPVHNGGKGVS